MPAITLPALTPYLATAGIGWLYYRRIRRSFGRQPWQPKRTVARLVLVSLVSLALLAAAIYLPQVGPGIGIGAVLLGWWWWKKRQRSLFFKTQIGKIRARRQAKKAAKAQQADTDHHTDS